MLFNKNELSLLEKTYWEAQEILKKVNNPQKFSEYELKMQELSKVEFNLQATYKAVEYPGRAVLYKSLSPMDGSVSDLYGHLLEKIWVEYCNKKGNGWFEFIKNIECLSFPGHHMNILEDEHLEEIVGHIAAVIAD